MRMSKFIEFSYDTGTGHRAWQCTPGFLPGESPRTEEPHRLQSMVSPRAVHD